MIFFGNLHLTYNNKEYLLLLLSKMASVIVEWYYLFVFDRFAVVLIMKYLGYTQLYTYSLLLRWICFYKVQIERKKLLECLVVPVHVPV